MKNRIREARKANNYSQGDVAKALGITRQAASLYETGKREPKLETWQKLAAFLKVSVPYLQGFEQARDRNRTDYRYFIEADGRKYYGADELIFKNLGGQWFLVGYSTAGCRTLINAAKIVAIEEMYTDKDKQND